MNQTRSPHRNRRSHRVPTRLLLLVAGGFVLPATTWGALSGKHASGKAEAAIRRDLDASGLEWAQVHVDGGSALLTGRVPDSGLGSLALDVARAATCRKLLRDGPCVRSVKANFGLTIREDERWPELVVQVDGGVLTVSGTVPDQESRQVVLESARASLASPLVDRVVDDLVVSGATSPAGLRPLLRRVTSAVALCRTGRASVADGRTTMRCDAAPMLADSVRYLLATPLPTGTLEALEVTSPVPGLRS